MALEVSAETAGVTLVKIFIFITNPVNYKQIYYSLTFLSFMAGSTVIHLLTLMSCMTFQALISIMKRQPHFLQTTLE